MSQSVLDRLRQTVLDGREGEAAKGGASRPEGRRVYVDPSGKIVIGDGVDAEERLPLSEVHPAVFAAAR